MYQPQVLRLLRAKRTPDAEDVASQVWIDVGRALTRFDGDGSDFRRWIFTITSRRSVDAFRATSRRSAQQLDRLDDVGPQPYTDDDFEAAGALERALAIVSMLPPATAEAVMLRIVYDLSVAEVAEVMDREPGTVRVLVHRGVNRLRQLVAADPNDGAAALSAERPAEQDVTLHAAQTLI